MTRGRRLGRALVLSALLGLASGCVGPVRGLYPPAPGEAVKSVYVVNHGWHTGIVVRRHDVAEALWPELGDFADSEYVEVGWGDRDFYQALEATSGQALKAILWSTASVLHVAGFSAPPERAFPGRDIVEVTLLERSLERLVVFIRDAYARDEAGRAIPLGPGQYSYSRFYLAREKYFLLKTCNNWTARALRAAGFPITPLYAVTARNVMYQAGQFGRSLAPRAGPRG
jgi:uncharacterized protein (TIGR02117 family)